MSWFKEYVPKVTLKEDVQVFDEKGLVIETFDEEFEKVYIEFPKEDEVESELGS